MMKNFGQSLMVLIVSVFCVSLLAACTVGQPASLTPSPEPSPNPSGSTQPIFPVHILPDQPAKACTMEAKVCADGSTVGRTGPNCEFAPCPSPKPTGHSAGN